MDKREWLYLAFIKMNKEEKDVEMTRKEFNEDGSKYCLVTYKNGKVIRYKVIDCKEEIKERGCVKW